MVIDYGSVLLAVGAAGAALCFTLFSNWLKQRSSGYLATWAVTMAVIIATVVCFAIFGSGGPDLLGLVACVLLIVGFAMNWGTTDQFATGMFPLTRTIAVAAVGALMLTVPFVFGADAVTFVLCNLAAAALVTLAGARFYSVRAESPTAIATIAYLHFGFAVTFVLCALVIGAAGSPTLQGMPTNWAEQVNLIACVICTTGIGGLIVTVHQERIARALRHAANTDALTGTLNRRAINDHYPDGTVPAETAMIVFDLDDFKGVNDRHGHTFGDTVLMRFAGLMQEAVQEAGLCARLGGEEFSVILPHSGQHQAKALAEMVRLRFAHQRFAGAGGPAACTVSAGIAVSGAKGCSLDQLMGDADAALYVSKRNGRNRVTTTGTRRAA